MACGAVLRRAFWTGFRDQFRLWRHLLIPAEAVVVFLFPGKDAHGNAYKTDGQRTQ